MSDANAIVVSAFFVAVELQACFVFVAFFGVDVFALGVLAVWFSALFVVFFLALSFGLFCFPVVV